VDRREVQIGIRASWNAAVELALGETFGVAAPLPVNEEFRDLLFSADVQYNRLYLAGLELRHYNILLKNFSFLQYSVGTENSLRFAYYPNPFMDTVTTELDRLRELLEADLISEEEFLALVDEHRSDNRAAPIRYESAPRDRRAFAHPSSHFHIGHGVVGRWAVARELTPLAFTLLVLKHYFPTEWFSADGDQEIGNTFEKRLMAERRSCVEVPEDLFSESERRCFHFT